MSIPETGARPSLTHTHAAPQRSLADAPPHRPGLAPPRGRGPHPLPVFLAVATRACAGDPALLARVLAGLRRYQAAPPGVARPARPAVARVAGATLRDHGGSGPIVVVVPSLINPPTVLDLAAGNSLLDGLAERGLRVLLVDWGPTEAAGLAELVETRLVPLVAGLAAPVALAGYCLGGTLAVAAAALLGPGIERLALLAAPWHFAGYGGAEGQLAGWWRDAAPLAERLGAMPMDLLQPAFWELDPAGLAAKYARFGDAAEGAASTAFVTLEDWSNSGQPLSLAAARELAEDLFQGDLPGRGSWVVGGRRIDPARLSVPTLDIIAGRDRIVPPGAALSAAGPGVALPLDAGHVGMIVGSRAPGLLWGPLAAWLRDI